MVSKKILFVDDEPVVAQLMKTRLMSRNLQVETACDGAEAVRKAKEWQPDLILLDVIMPQMDGFETCRELKRSKQTAGIPVVFFTASQETQLEQRAREVGAEGLVQKPFIDQVFKMIAELLEGA
ncbi:MAG: response regulator [Candidatus Omnitrophica bacterium]|nr:response regulator [Candidatus Omnitrophota bacterium]